ncbi:MAG: LacI family DNA-binding transcriptional regulator [Opitutaceae bacterium]
MSSEQSNTRVSLRDIAKKLGISHVSVSLALRDSPRISEQRKKQVKEAAEKMGYSPDPMLCALANYRQQKDNQGIHSALAWINQWSDKSQLRQHKEFDAYWNGAKEAATKLGFRLEEFHITKDLSGSRLLTILKTRNIRGILIPPHPSGIDLKGFDWSQFSSVRFGYSVRESRVHLVTTEMVANAMLAYRKMRENGYQRIGLVAQESFDTNTRHNIRAGFKAAEDLQTPSEQQIPPLFLKTMELETNTNALREWLDHYKPDAILSCSPAVKELLDALDVKVPDDIGVAVTSILDAFYDSGIDQNSYEIGKVAVSKLAGLIHENETGLPKIIRRTAIEGVWVQGESLPVKN